MTFTSEVENEGSLSFLDVMVPREDNIFGTLLYRKPTFSGVFANYNSFIPLNYKRGLLLSLFHRAFVICSSYHKFHKEILYLKAIF